MDEVKKNENRHTCPGGWKCKYCGPKDKYERRSIRKRVRLHIKHKDKKEFDNEETFRFSE